MSNINDLIVVLGGDSGFPRGLRMAALMGTLSKHEIPFGFAGMEPRCHKPQEPKKISQKDMDRIAAAEAKRARKAAKLRGVTA